MNPNRDTRRRFSARERAALLIAAGGRCAECGDPLQPDFHADHRDAWAHGGLTDVTNGQALCPACNRRKSDRPVVQIGPFTGPNQAARSTGTASAAASAERHPTACAHEPADVGHDDTPECHKEIS